MKLDHPSVRNVNLQKEPPVFSSIELRQLALDCGAADAGLVSIDDPLLNEERDEILRSFPQAKTIISIICRMNPHSVRAPQRSVANHEFHHTGYEMDEICRNIAHKLNAMGIPSMNEPMAFPMEYADFPGKSWIISHKKVAVAAGLGQMGIHRNVIHPKFGNFILLGSVLVAQEIPDLKSTLLNYNPCLECKLCVAACPVGAIHADGYFNFSACMTHNYREFMGGFVDWVKTLTESTNMKEYKAKFNDGETVSLWQSLTYGANYKAAYCMAVCPAGEDVLAPYLKDKKAFVSETLKPLTEKSEVIYVVKGSDAEEHVEKRFKNKKVKIVSNGLSVKSIQSFLMGSKLIFQPGRAKNVKSRIHFRFLGDQTTDVTYLIEDQKLQILNGHQGAADLTITAKDSDWLRFVNKELGLAWALVSRKIRPRGSLQHFRTFGKLFPS